MMTANEIRQQFIDFFCKKHGHTFVPSSPVVPQNDPTLLFTNAGMNQFKPYFLGTEKPRYKRVANTQKCIRASGKHNDLEDVGRDTYHHTFFEMLGNWSFGDYYKAEAIRWAWELLTKEWGLDKSRLHATVFGGDKEFNLEADEDAAKLWTSETDIDPSHVHRFGKKDNFWMMGETGPCGPCSEIHYDRTPDKSGGKLVNAGDARVIEIWNLVFIQYNRDDKGELHLLPAKHVDTGMGFERICAVLQKKDSNYDTDVFTPIMDAIGKLVGKKYGARLDDLDDIAFRVMADHLRMLTFAITDGARPDRTGQGSVLVTVLRRAVLHGYQRFNQREPLIYKLVPALVEHMGRVFPELKNNPKRVEEIIRGEEAAFLRTLETKLPTVEKEVRDVWVQGATQVQPAGVTVADYLAERAFVMATTHGVPVELTNEIAKQHNLTLNMETFTRRMAEHAEKSKGVSIPRTVSDQPGMTESITATVVRSKVHVALNVSGGLPATDDRLKWNSLTGGGVIIGWIASDQVVKQGELTTGMEGGVVLDKTCFYAEQGGQVGDQGTITTSTGAFTVVQTVKIGAATVHVGYVTTGRIEVGQVATLAVSPDREFTRKNHTATHLLHWALHRVLGEHVEQRGSKVKPDEFTFDFSHTGPMTKDEMDEIERLINEKIYADLPVQARELSQAEARKLPGVKAFFGDKYGDVVRVVEIGDGFSREFCGGTHLNHTGQAGYFVIIREDAVGKGVRRLTCNTGPEAVRYGQKLHRLIMDLTEKFHCKWEEFPSRVEAMEEQIKKLQQQLKKGAATDLASTFDKLLASATKTGDISVVIGEIPAGPDDAIRTQVDRVKQKAGSCVVVVGWTDEGKVGLLAAASDDVVKRGVKAGDLIKQIAPVVGGGGGGRPNMAQAGGKDPAKLGDALTQARKLIDKQLIK
jgi:alanyl-tRNA synthetase